MSEINRKTASLLLTQARKEMAEARAGDDPHNIAVAAANLGYALFQVNKFSEGRRSFKEVERIFKQLDDFKLQVHCLAIQTTAYQATEQFPQAFETAQNIEKLAVTKEDEEVQCDALATQGQILIDSGEEVIANKKLNEALEIAKKIGDKRRQMNAVGAMGNYCMTIASADKAEAYFRQARQLAHEVGDRQAEIGFHGNIGTILEWKGHLQEASQIFSDVAAFVHEVGNSSAELQAYRHLVNVHSKMNDLANVVIYAQQGVSLAQESNDEIIYHFYKHLISTNYRLNKLTEARNATSEAIEKARTDKNRKLEIDFLLGLGESYMVTNELEQSLASYKDALAVAVRMQRMTDMAHLLGRVGVVLAELNRTDEAIQHHEEAIALARTHELPDLEGEQLVMLAMAFDEKGEIEKAKRLCETAVSVYTRANLTEQANKARSFLAELALTGQHV
ncbi:tetratricopeptide repeat protein [Candidatus Leptofilum sp.]|uniref:tetratricopeptide repeat protein n=1 Tax=Candidatus Leptofilum sp. TaxID=3241576 RepID=UPI003B5BCE10